MKLFSVIILAILVFTVCLVTNIYAMERMVIRLDSPEPELIKELTRENYDIAAYRPGEFLDLVVTREQYQKFRDMGYDPQITQREEQLRGNLQLRDRTIPGYRTYDDVLDEIETLALEHPDIVRIYDLGDSWANIYTQEGNDYYSNYQHDILAVKVTTDPDSLNDKPAVFYMGAHHAREPLSTEVAMEFLNHLLDNYTIDDYISYLIDATEIWFIPIVNPDGHKVVLNEVDIWWRKNLRDNNNNGQFDTYGYYGYGTDGVDPNRNYPFEWGADNQLTAPTYPGPYGGSEPEVDAMIQLLNDHHFVAGITYHTYSELVLYPYGYDDNVYAPDVDALSDLAVQMATTIPNLNSPGHYTPQASWALYPARGATDDYAYGEHGIFSYTIELGVEFIPPPADIEQITADNLEAAMLLLRRIHHSSLTGHVTDAITGEPLVAEVFIAGIDDTGNFREPYRSNEVFGRYYRILLPGEYEVTFSAYGYVDSEPQVVSITEEEQTTLNIALNPAGEGSLEGIVVDFFEQTPIANAVVTILNSPLDPVTTNNEGVFYFDEVAYGIYQIKVEAENYGLHTEEIVISEPENNYSFYLYTPYLVDSFDDLSNWITTGDWGLSSIHAYSGDYSLADSPQGDYNSNVNSYALFNQPINLVEAENASITFMVRYDLEPSYDYCYLQVDSGDEEWETITTFNGISDWELKQYSLNNYLGEEISIRFYFSSDQSVEEEGIFIDDFTIYISSPELDVPVDINPISRMELYQNYPNPFNPETTISFSLVEESQVSLEIYNIIGQRVRCLVEENLEPGFYNLVWDGKNAQQISVGSGVYFYRLQAGDSVAVKKMILLK